MRRGAEILDRPACSFAKGRSGMQWPVGVAQHFAGEEDEVGLAVGNDGVGLRGLGDHADGGSGDAGFGADACGERTWKSGADGDIGVGSLAAGGAVDEIDAMGAQDDRQGRRNRRGTSRLQPSRWHEMRTKRGK